jgi:GNAT superfamily N-acetyltransferase
LSKVQKSRSVSFLEQWITDQENAHQTNVGSPSAWVIPNVHGVDRLFVGCDVALTVNHIEDIWRLCVRDSLVLTSPHPLFLHLAQATQVGIHLFRWIEKPVPRGVASVKWASTGLELELILKFHLCWQGNEASAADRWALAIDEEGCIAGIIAQTSSTSSVGFTSSLVVHPARRRHGIGCSLLAHALNDHLQFRSAAALTQRADNLPSKQLCDRLNLKSAPFVALDPPLFRQLAMASRK